MAAGRTFLPDADFPERQREIIVNNNHILSRCVETKEEQCHHFATLIHVRLWLDQYGGLPAQNRFSGNQGWTTVLVDLNVLTRGDPLQSAKPGIVIRAGVFFARIAQPDDEPHLFGWRFLLFFLAL